MTQDAIKGFSISNKVSFTFWTSNQLYSLLKLIKHIRKYTQYINVYKDKRTNKIKTMASLNIASFRQSTWFLLLALIHCLVLVSANSVMRTRFERSTNDAWQGMQRFKLKNIDTSTYITGKNNLSRALNKQYYFNVVAVAN